MKGMNPVVSGVLVVVIIVASSAIVMHEIVPAMDKTKDMQNFDTAKETMSVLNSVINELIFEATGAQRVVQISGLKGKFTVNSKLDSMSFLVDAEKPLFEPGTRSREGNIEIVTGPYVKSYESDIDEDGDTDLVLENDAVIFAVQKIGNITSYGTLNTTAMITFIKIKDLDVKVVPKSGIIIDEDGESSYGTGYTELTETGNYLVSSGIRVVVAAHNGISYEALFTLAGGNDFVELVIKNIE